MRVLLFSHKSDIDGMGSIILARLAFEDLTYILCETYELQDRINELYETNEIYDYDMIYVTDMWLENPTLTKIAKDRKLNGKFFIFDHHKSAIEEGLDCYAFTKIIVKDSKGRCCGTSLFYEYLLANNFLEKHKGIYQFVELTRKYDTWEWKTRYNEEEANDLNILFNLIGANNYINSIYNKLNSDGNHFNFTIEEQKLINYKKIKISEKLEIYANNIFYRIVDGYKAGIIFIEYEYRNDIAQYLRDKNYEIDFIILISLANGTLTLRNINFDVNVRRIAEKLNGKGHDNAAGCLIEMNQKDQIIDLLLSIKQD